MATSKSIPRVPVSSRNGAPSFHRDYLIRMGFVRPSLASQVKTAKLAGPVQGDVA